MNIRCLRASCVYTCSVSTATQCDENLHEPIYRWGDEVQKAEKACPRAPNDEWGRCVLLCCPQREQSLASNVSGMGRVHVSKPVESSCLPRSFCSPKTHIQGPQDASSAGSEKKNPSSPEPPAPAAFFWFFTIPPQV